MDSNTLRVAAAGALMLGGVAGLYLYTSCSGPSLTVVGKVDDFKVGKMREVEVKTGSGSEKILVIRESATRFRACGATCTHANVPLVGGVLGCETSRLVCPSHGACFNTATGDIEDG